MTVEERIEVETKVMRHLIRTMAKHGWDVHSVNDGEGCDRVKTEQEAINAVQAVDEAWLYFQKGNAKHGVYLVQGNDGYDVICDYHYALSDDFETVMDKEVNPYVDKVANELQGIV